MNPFPLCPNDDLGIACQRCTCRTQARKVVAVIPCFGRFSLLKKTVSRLYERNGIDKVILIGHEPQVKQIAQETNSEFVTFVNKPLGAKWNKGFQHAKHLKATEVLFVGSSDWISDNWISTALKYIDEGYDLVGKLGCHLIDINTLSGKRLCEWPGYGHGVRSEEPIGIGRVISSRVLDKINWTPFDDSRDNSMDWFMYDRVLKHSGQVKIMTDEVYSMAISTNKWENKHRFEEHWKGQLPSKKIKGEVMQSFLNTHFPDVTELKF